jgi:hypothetical protein
MPKIIRILVNYDIWFAVKRCKDLKLSAWLKVYFDRITNAFLP